MLDGIMAQYVIFEGVSRTSHQLLSRNQSPNFFKVFLSQLDEAAVVARALTNHEAA